MKNELKNHGLQFIGNWISSNQHASVSHLKEKCKIGINFELLTEWKKKRNVVYAFVSNGHVRYIGETSAGMNSRFTGYRYGNPLVRDTDNRIKMAITEVLNCNESVEIWAVCPIADYKLPSGKILTVPASKPLEEHLIGVLKPDLNVKNLYNGKHG